MNTVLHKLSFIIFISCFFITPCCEKNPAAKTADSFFRKDADESLVNDTLKTIFYDDAAELALRLVINDPEKKYSQIVIPEDDIQLFYNARMYVYQSESSYRDSTVRYFIHTHHKYRHHELVISVDPHCGWLSAFIDDSLHSGIAEFDTLLSEYELRLKEVHSYPSSTTLIILSTPLYLNMLALSAQLDSLNLFNYVEPNYIVGDGSDIEGTALSDVIELRYAFKWGDCMAGCTAEHYWTFHIDKNGNVEIVDYGGDSIPEMYDDPNYPWDLILISYYNRTLP